MTTLDKQSVGGHIMRRILGRTAVIALVVAGAVAGIAGPAAANFINF